MVIYPKSEKKKTPVFKEKLRSFNILLFLEAKFCQKKKFKIQNSKIKGFAQAWWAIQLQESFLVTIFHQGRLFSRTSSKDFNYVRRIMRHYPMTTLKDHVLGCHPTTRIIFKHHLTIYRLCHA
jgi:hypothetical protein